MEALIQDDIYVIGILLGILAFVFATSSSTNRFFKAFYSVVPPVFLCYFIPGLLNSFGVISGEKSALGPVGSSLFLPVSLVLFTLGLDVVSLKKLGPKALLVFLAASVGIIIGGPSALLACKFMAPQAFVGQGDEEVWKGMSSIAGSWIGGSANQAAMKEMFQPSPTLFSSMVAVDVVIANVLMMFLLFMIGRNKAINTFLRADDSAIEDVKQRLRQISEQHVRIPSLTDLMLMLGLAFGATSLAHLAGKWIAPWAQTTFPEMAQRLSLSSSFFWMVLIVSFIGILLSFTPFKKLEAAGASRLGSVFLYILVATIGMKMDILAIVNQPVFFLMGLIWISIHIGFTFFVARLLKAPFFFVAVGSQANVGGAASAPVVAAAFDTSLAPVGALLAILGYAIGTYGAYISALLMQAVY